MHKALQSYNCNYSAQLTSNEVHLKLDSDCTVFHFVLKIPLEHKKMAQSFPTVPE